MAAKKATKSNKAAASSVITGKLKTGETVSLDVNDLKEVLGKKLTVACLNPQVIPGTRGSIMIPSNEPCPVEPHNHDGALKNKFFQKVLVINQSKK